MPLLLGGGVDPTHIVVSNLAFQTWWTKLNPSSPPKNNRSAQGPDHQLDGTICNHIDSVFLVNLQGFVWATFRDETSQEIQVGHRKRNWQTRSSTFQQETSYGFWLCLFTSLSSCSKVDRRATWMIPSKCYPLSPSWTVPLFTKHNTLK